MDLQIFVYKVTENLRSSNIIVKNIFEFVSQGDAGNPFIFEHENKNYVSFINFIF